MLLSVFEKLIFLQSLGWGIISSLWQAALLFAVYKTVVSNSKKLSPAVKYNAAVLMQSGSFVWFISTITQNYNAALSNSVISSPGWLQVSAQVDQMMQWVSIAYCIVLMVHIAIFIKNVNRLLLLRNRSIMKAPADIRIFTDQSAFHLGIKKEVKVWLSNTATVPSVIGFFKPVILLPAMVLNNLTQAQAEAVILHELAHIKRNDYLINFLQSIVEMLMFFNPFVKLLGREVRKERENCCDDWVMNYRYNRHDYASALLALEKYRFEYIQLAPAATNGQKALLARVKRLFAEEPEVNIRPSQKIKLGIAAFSLVVTALVVLPFAGTRKSLTTPLPDAGGTAVFAKSALPVYSENKKLAIIIADKPAERKQKLRKPAVKRTAEPTTEENIELSTALINAELLEKEAQQSPSIAIAAANREMPVPDKLYVQVEEERSGSSDKKTYVVELNNDNGTANIKPLLLVNKKVKNISWKNKKAKLAPVNKRVAS